jgi:hypothetical protein
MSSTVEDETEDEIDSLSFSLMAVCLRLEAKPGAVWVGPDESKPLRREQDRSQQAAAMQPRRRPLTSCIDVANVGVGLRRPPEEELAAVAWPMEAREAPNVPKPRMLDRLLTIEVDEGVRTLRERATLDCEEGESVIDGRRSSAVLPGPSIGWMICCDLTDE